MVLAIGCGRFGFDDSLPPDDNYTAADPGDQTVQDPSTYHSQPGSTLPTAQMVAYWGFEDLTDNGAMSSVNSYMATCADAADCPTSVAGALGKGASFDGTAACMHVPTLGSVTPANITMSAWINMSAAELAGTQPVITRDADACPSPGIEVMSSQVGFLFMGANTGDHYHAWTAAPSPGVWHQLGVRWDGTTEYVFIDGVCACSAVPGEPLAYDGNDYEIEIGCDDDESWFTSGAIDEVRVYTRSLSDDEMASLYAIGGRAQPTPISCPATCTVTTAGP
jgi:hypothetical protein